MSDSASEPPVEQPVTGADSHQASTSVSVGVAVGHHCRTITTEPSADVAAGSQPVLQDGNQDVSKSSTTVCDESAIVADANKSESAAAVAPAAMTPETTHAQPTPDATVTQSASLADNVAQMSDKVTGGDSSTKDGTLTPSEADKSATVDSDANTRPVSHSPPVPATTEAKEGVVVGATVLHDVPSDTSSEGHNVYHVKWIKFRGTSTPIVMQNQNGPCPLLAIVNVLLLQGKIKLITGTELVASDQLMAYIADWIFDNVPKHITEATRLNYEQNMHDAIAVFPRLQTGLDVNVKFTGIADFEYTPECVVFDLLDIPLVHGWLVDPHLSQTVEAVGSYSYNQLVERIISNKVSTDPAAITSALAAEEFLNSSASQLTYHGLCELSATLNDEQICVLFRNNHFSTLYKHKKELFVLATDQGFLNEPNVVWETLSNVEGDGHFVDASFHTYRLPEIQSSKHVAGSAGSATVSTAAYPAPPANSKEQIDHDYLVALSLEQDQSETSGSDVWLAAPAATGSAPLSDHDLALKLQREEELNAGAPAGSALQHSQASARQLKTQPTAAAAASSDGETPKAEKKSDCILL